MGDESLPAVTAVVLAYGQEPLLERCVSSLLREVDVDVRVVLVDNGADPGVVTRVAEDERVSLVRPAQNLGFAGGANLGARSVREGYLIFVNSDAIVERGALGALVAALRDPAVGLVSASVRLLHHPDLLNSRGNPVHVTGLSWAGGFGQPAGDDLASTTVASVSGAAMACTTSTWALLGGFCEQMFTYHEDTDLSLRCWQAGLKVLYVPEAVVLHDYEFSRNSQKMGLLERNRLIMLTTLYDRRALVVLAPLLAVLEVATLAMAVRQGWWRDKLSGWAWLYRHRIWIAERRRRLQARRVIDGREFLGLLTTKFEPGQQVSALAQRLVTLVSSSYLRLVRL